MECCNAQRMFGDLADGKLSPSVAEELRRHIAECTDCRVAQQRAGRLLQLLALKRHETPGPAYFNNFLNEFHRRLADETAPQPGWREKLVGRLELVSSRFWQYGLAGAVGVCVLGIALWYSTKNTPESVKQPVVAEIKPTEVVVPVSTAMPPSAVLPLETVSFSDNPAGDAPTGVIVLPSAVRAERNAPRYVLDHVTTSPHGYETVSCDF